MSRHRIGGITLCLSALTLAFAGCNKSSNDSQPSVQAQQTCTPEIEQLAIQLDEELLEVQRLYEGAKSGWSQHTAHGSRRQLKVAARNATATCSILFDKMTNLSSCNTLSQIRGQSVVISTTSFADDCDLAYEISSGSKSRGRHHR